MSDKRAREPGNTEPSPPAKRTKKEMKTMVCQKGDLFDREPHIALAHCVSRDFHMNAGIARVFKRKFGKPLAPDKRIGDVAVVETKESPSRFIYNLVTKERFFHKPTYKTLQASLQAMKQHAVAHEVSAIAMPKIGCGLDKLDWDIVQSLIMQTFADCDVDIRVYEL
jgi:O-acetyl-ADP-ribose deacetylase (regulator of RNase III)